MPAAESADAFNTAADLHITLLSSLLISDDEHDATLAGAEGDAVLLGPPLPIQGPSSKPFWVTLKKNKSTPKSMSKIEKVCCAEFEKNLNKHHKAGSKGRKYLIL